MTAAAADLLPGWRQTEYGSVNHAVGASGRSICGVTELAVWPADPGATPCRRCLESVGPAMPPPPGGWPADHRRAVAHGGDALGQSGDVAERGDGRVPATA